MAVWLLPQAWDATVAALASGKAGPAAVAAFRRILSGYARRACSWGELEGRLAGVPLQKVRGRPARAARARLG
jgi:hypothetical protein